MKLYVGTYKKYNEGSLYGAWLDLDDYEDKQEFLEACAELHKDEKEPEFMFQDFEAENTLEEDFYCECAISETYWTDYKDIVENCNIDLDIIGEYISLHGLEVADGIKQAEECYCGTFDNEIDFAQNEIENCYPELEDSIPNFIYNAIDWQHVANELGYDYDYIKTKNYDVAVFRHY